MRVPFEVCAASFTSQNHELVLFSRSKLLDEDELQDHFAVFVVCLKTGKLKTPKIDIAVHSDTSPPAFSLTKTIPTLGTDYLYVGIGCNHVGVFSLATGLMVRDIEMGLPQAASIMELNFIERNEGDAKDVLCCRCFSPAEKTNLYFFLISDLEALESTHGISRASFIYILSFL